MVSLIGTTTPSRSSSHPMFITTWSSDTQMEKWNEIGVYRNGGVYSTRVMSRLLSSFIDDDHKSRRIVFQLNLQGKDVGAYEVDYLCESDHQFISRKTIPVPQTPSVTYFSSNFRENYLEGSIVISTRRYCGDHPSSRS